MKYRAGLVVALTLAAVHGTQAQAPQPPRLGFFQAIVTDSEFRIAIFRHMDVVFPSRVIHNSGPISALQRSERTLPVSYEWQGKRLQLSELLSRSKTTGLLVIKDGRIVAERYFLGAGEASKLTSFSVAKSFTSTLVGLAIADGRIKSVNQPVTEYLPELGGSGYGGVPIKAILQMSSGVKFTEDYSGTDDVSKMFQRCMIQQEQPLNDYAKSLGRLEPAGKRFYYRSIDTQVLGWLVERVTGEPLANYLSRSLWTPLGMESDAYWDTDGSGMESAFAFLNATLRDYGKFGLLFLNKGKWNGKQIVPAAWVAEATTPDSPRLQPGRLAPDYPLGYQYQWWIFPGDDGAFEAQGIFGQFIYVNPRKNVVIVKTSASDAADDTKMEVETYAAFAAIVNEVSSRD